MKKFQMYGGAAVLLTLLASGCYSYQPPASATLGESYTARKKDAADELLKDVKVLTLLDAQRIAIKNNPTYIAAYHSVQAARMKYYQAWGAYSPTLSASFTLQDQRSWKLNATNPTYSEGSDTPHADAFTTDTGVTAQLLLFDGFARYFKLKAAKSSLNYQERMEEDACRTMMLSVSYAYNTVLLAIEKRRIAMEDRKFQLESLQNTQYKFEAGAAPLSDVLNFEIQVNNAEVSLVAADYSYDIALYALAVLMGYPDGTLPPDIEFTGDFKKHFSELPAIEIYLDAALANRPDLKAYREQLNVAKYQVYQSYGAYSPTVSGFVKFGYGTNATIHNYYNPERVRDYYDIMNLSYGITADWTIFNGLIRYNQMRAAQASLAVADYQVAQQWLSVVEEVRSAYANYIQNVKKTRLYSKVRELSSKQRDLVDDEYRAGNAELTRLNEAQRDLVEAETNLASSYINVQNAKAQLDSVVGGNTARYYLDKKAEEFALPGLGNLPNAVEQATAAGQNVGQTAPAAAPNALVTPAPVPAAKKAVKPAAAPAPVKSAAPAIPASATAAPAVK